MSHTLVVSVGSGQHRRNNNTQNKMKFYCLTIFLIILTTNTSAWVSQGKYYNEANPGKCTINDNLVLAPGEKVKDPNQCAMYHCRNEHGMTKHYGCGVMRPPPNCVWGEMIDNHAPYPDCCKRHLICSEAQNQTNRNERESNGNKRMQVDNLILGTLNTNLGKYL